MNASLNSNSHRHVSSSPEPTNTTEQTETKTDTAPSTAEPAPSTSGTTTQPSAPGSTTQLSGSTAATRSTGATGTAADQPATRPAFRLEEPATSDVERARAYAIAAQAVERATTALVSAVRPSGPSALVHATDVAGGRKSDWVSSLFGEARTASFQQAVSAVRGEGAPPAPTVDKAA